MDLTKIDGLLNEAFRDNVGSYDQRRNYFDNLLELKNTFKVQYCALMRIQEQQFFERICSSFENAMVSFLEMIACLRKYEESLHQRYKNNKDLLYEVFSGLPNGRSLANVVRANNSDSAKSFDRNEIDNCKIALESRGLSFKSSADALALIEHKADEREAIQAELFRLENNIIFDSYQFIKAFDNALQGFFNSDRQFLEFPGHHVSLYDLPIKLGTVYISFVERVIKAFDSIKPYDKDVSLSFLLCPEPFESQGAHVNRLLASSYEIYSKYMTISEIKSEICLISVPFSELFNPEKLCVVLAHEIAHYVARRYRHTKERNKFLKDACCYEFGQAVVLNLYDYLTGCEKFDSMPAKNQKKLIEDISVSYSDEYEKELDDVIEDEMNRMNLVCDVGNDYSSVFTLTSMEYLIALPVNWLHSINDRAVSDIYRKIPEMPEEMFKHLKEDFGQTIKDELDKRIGLLFFVVREAVADILAISLLRLGREAYERCIDSEINKSRGSQNPDSQRLADYQSFRKQLVLVTFGWERECTIDDITKKTLKELIKYLKSVKIGVVRENEASKMVSKILEDKAPVVLPEYMI